MAVSIPLEPSLARYRVSVTIGDFNVTFAVRWNARDVAWYFDLYDEDETVIVAGCKIVLGVNIGRLSTHSFFDGRMLRAFDTSGEGREATFDDIGRRVQLVAIDVADVFGT